MLVTGGAGYIGSHTLKLLLEKKYSLAVIDNLSRGYRQPLEVIKKKVGHPFKFYPLDLLDYSALNKVFQKEKPEAIIHFAALCLVNESMEHPEPYFENNVVGSLNLLRVAIANRVKHLVFSSTCAVYGEAQYLPVDEKHPLNPVNPYGESKLMVEKMIQWFGQTYGLNYVILRYFNVCGADRQGLIGDSKKPSQLLVQNAVRGALGIALFKLTCPQVKTKDGTPIRDYLNVEDLADAHLLALRYLQKGGKSEVFNLGTGKGNSVLEIVQAVQKITGKNFSLTRGKARKGEYAEIFADNRKIKKVLDWQPKRSLKDSIESLVRWYQSHPQGWQY